MAIDSQTQRLTTNPPIAMDIDEETKSSSVLKKQLTTIIKRVAFISIASTFIMILTLTVRFYYSKYVAQERAFSLADIQDLITFGIVGTFFLKSIAILAIFPLLCALGFVCYIKKGVIHRRHIGDGLKKFLQFNLTMCIVVGILGNVIIQDIPFGRWDHLLWLFIIDVIVSIALATDISAEYRDIRKTKTLFSKFLAKNIIGHAIYQIVAVFILFLAPNFILNVEHGRSAPFNSPPSIHFTAIFNTFCLMTLFNAFNSRKIQGEHNIFKGLFNNPIFCVIITLFFILQIFIVQYSDEFLIHEEGIYDDDTGAGHIYENGYHGWFFLTSLNLSEWGICLAFGLGELLWGQIITAIPPRQ